MAAGRSKNAGTFKLFSHVVGTLLQIPPQISSLSYDGNEDWIEKKITYNCSRTTWATLQAVKGKEKGESIIWTEDKYVIW